MPALAAFLRQDEVPFFHVRYEDLVKAPEEHFARICEHIGVPYEESAVIYGEQPADTTHQQGLGDPIGVKQHTRPQTGSVKKWARELATDPAKLKLMRDVLNQVDPDDLETIGYPADTIWKPMEELPEDLQPPKPPKLDRYRLQRRAIIRLRQWAQRGGPFRKLLERVRLTCDVLLRE
mgnify:FL=1